MSDFNYHKKSKAPLIATIVVAVLAVAAVVVLIYVLKKPVDEPDSSNSRFEVTQEFRQECEYAAHDLISQSYEVMRLFVFEGLSYMSEPYGNEPEDGLYTVYTEDNSKYSTLEDIEELVKSVYTDSAAEKILNNVDGNGLEVFKKRKVLVEAEYDSEPESSESRPMYVEKEVLGISAAFKPDTSKKEMWANCSVIVDPISPTSCTMKVYLGGVDDSTDLSAVDESLVVNLEMTKTADGWRLTDFVC